MSFISDLFSHDETAPLAGLNGEQTPISPLGTPVASDDEAHGVDHVGGAER